MEEVTWEEEDDAAKGACTKPSILPTADSFPVWVNATARPRVAVYDVTDD